MVLPDQIHAAIPDIGSHDLLRIDTRSIQRSLQRSLAPDKVDKARAVSRERKQRIVVATPAGPPIRMPKAHTVSAPVLHMVPTAPDMDAPQAPHACAKEPPRAIRQPRLQQRQRPSSAAPPHAYAPVLVPCFFRDLRRSSSRVQMIVASNRAAAVARPPSGFSPTGSRAPRPQAASAAAQHDSIAAASAPAPVSAPPAAPAAPSSPSLHCLRAERGYTVSPLPRPANVRSWSQPWPTQDGSAGGVLATSPELAPAGAARFDSWVACCVGERVPAAVHGTSTPVPPSPMRRHSIAA